ncbi:hypothetical protein [Bradyrhizobium genosp. A]|uniref:hypothetical protein n=1 Tax=Bradyrhizobium genosp. A TaxID=83626 RepID=UPI003CF13B3E
MKDEKVARGEEKTAGIERRSLLGAAAAVAVGAATESQAKEKETAPDSASITAAGYSYVYQDYAGSYTDTWFVQKILSSADQLRKKFQRNKLEWGNYQKTIPGTDKPAGWGKDPTKAKFLFRNWESAVDDARKDLAKRPAPLIGPDPDNPNNRAKSLLDHLDESIRFAIYDKKMPGQTQPGIEFDVQVTVQAANNRRHTLTVAWQPSGMPSPYNVKSLVIRMVCPLGGWLGYATLEAPATAGRITKFISKWKVPMAPSDVGQVVFVFNGLESVPGQGYMPGILQPVLQWTAAGGWTVRSWYVPETYHPTPEQLPDAGCEKLPGQQPNAMCANVGFPADNPNDNSANPYVTKADPVAKDDLLESHVEWDTGSQTYKCWFVHTPASGGAPVQRGLLTVPGLPAMTYAAAVIEGYILYNSKANNYIPPAGLPSPVEMDDVYVEFEITPGTPPAWDFGRDDPSTTSPVQYGTNRLRSYKVKSPPGSNKFVFTAKKPDS